MEPFWSKHALCLALAALGLAGCGPSPAPVEERVSAPAARAIRILGYSEYLPEPVIAKFQEQTGCQVIYESFDDADDMMGRMKSTPHRYDLVIGTDIDIQHLRQSWLLAEIDVTRLRGTANLNPEFIDAPTFPGLKWCLPYCWGSFAVVYLKDQIKDPEPSLKVLFDPPPGSRVLMLSDMYESFFLAELALGKKDLALDEASLKAAAELLKAQSEKAEVVYGSDDDFLKGMKDERYTVAIAYSGDAVVVAGENPHLGYFVPKEGVPVWLDVVAISRDAPEPGLAMEFLNFLLKPEIMAEISNEVLYPNANAASRPLLSEELTGNPVLFPPQSVLKHAPRFRWLSDEESIRLATHARLARLGIIEQQAGDTAQSTGPGEDDDAP